MSKTTGKMNREYLLKTYIYLMYSARNIFRFSNKLWMSKDHINLAKFMVLKSISVHGGKITHSKLADLSVTERSNITALIKGMKQEDLIEVEPDPNDKRVKYVKNTTKGRKILQRALLTESQIAESIMKGITQRQATELCRFLDKMMDNVNPPNRNSTCFSKNG